jgi:hypothetical protein
MILASKEIFIPKYIDMSKIHSIRKGERWRKGMSIQHFAKVRRPDMYKFMPDRICTGTQPIFITFNGYDFEVTVAGRLVFLETMFQLAKNDGFDSVDKFQRFFTNDFKDQNVEFSGQIVHWTDLRY